MGIKKYTYFEVYTKYFDEKSDLKIHESPPKSKTPTVLSVVCHKAVELILLAFFFHCTLCISPVLNENLSWWGSLPKQVA